MTLQERLIAMYGTGSSNYFVEAGAHDGVGDSQTKILEDAGWRGICVEPSSVFHALKSSRKCVVDDKALWDESGKEIEFWDIEGNGVELSGIVESFLDRWDREKMVKTVRKVKTVRLTDLLAYHGAPNLVQFLSLDTEGSELAILKAHEFDRFRFDSILVEYNGVSQRRIELLNLLLSIQRYRLDFDDGVNLFLVQSR